MKIRNLEENDLGGLFSLVSEVYRELPESMWFDHEPSATEFGCIFKEKIEEASSEKAVDIVASEGGKILGECEIVRKPGGIGFLGIIVSPGSRHRGVGGSLLTEAMKRCGHIGVSTIRAEVSPGNKEALGFLLDHGFTMDISKERRDERLKIRITVLERHA